jgi:hypothetical protein
MKRASFFAAVALAGAASAQPASQMPWMTGARLVKLMGNVDPATVNWTPGNPFPSRVIAAEFKDMTNGEFVHGYIQAVHDATEGREWCWNQYKPKPDELEADARHSLQRMPEAQLERNASDLIVEVWRKKFPCPTTQRRTK